MSVSPSDLEARAINAALEAADYLDRAFASLEREGAACVGFWPHQAALHALTVERIGRRNALNLTQLGWVPDWAESYSGSDDLDPNAWITVGSSPHWPRVVRREPRLSTMGTWPWLSPTGLRKAAASLQLMVWRGVLEQHTEYVEGSGYRLSEGPWESLRTVVRHIPEAETDELTGNRIWRPKNIRPDPPERLREG
jgi:hypothetical protein